MSPTTTPCGTGPTHKDVSHLVHLACRHVKHWVLDRAHPLPIALRLALGPPDSLDAAILKHTIDVFGIPCLSLVDTTEPIPQLWIDDADTPVEGTITIARYLGRLWRYHPIDPHNAAVVDASLERLQRFVLHDSAYSTHDVLTRLERAFENQEGPWMDDMRSMSVADVAWAGAVTWLDSTVEIPWVEFPHVAAWWLTMQAYASGDSE